MMATVPPSMAIGQNPVGPPPPVPASILFDGTLDDYAVLQSSSGGVAMVRGHKICMQLTIGWLSGVQFHISLPTHRRQMYRARMINKWRMVLAPSSGWLVVVISCTGSDPIPALGVVCAQLSADENAS
jgi:hypothetical protein